MTKTKYRIEIRLKEMPIVQYQYAHLEEASNFFDFLCQGDFQQQTTLLLDEVLSNPLDADLQTINKMVKIEISPRGKKVHHDHRSSREGYTYFGY
ncbi:MULTISPECIES: hypothetical protein [Persicobacter]|uniref:Uncharacterized protein n=1 Tax=Persicobacter diffluens TaxID=981 RepID=A0AAN4VTL3_9BACT|nr:hypothetical protein [Persicobacter sp. CCB-QB2]GJM59751.1 hypothetical protein PEDI_03030 [Persicobacter diffluens]